MFSTLSTDKSQRIQVVTEGPSIKIRLERFDERLGWYTAGSLVLPLDQVGALAETLQRIGETGSAEPDRIEPPAVSPFVAAFSE